MNKHERMAAAALAAEWEWGHNGGSSSEAAARARCAVDLIKALRIPDEDLAFARAWEIAGQMGIRDDEALFDALTDLIDEEGYTAVVDIIEGVGFMGLRERIAT